MNTLLINITWKKRKNSLNVHLVVHCKKLMNHFMKARVCGASYSIFLHISKSMRRIIKLSISKLNSLNFPKENFIYFLYKSNSLKNTMAWKSSSFKKSILSTKLQSRQIVVSNSKILNPRTFTYSVRNSCLWKGNGGRSI